MPLPLDIMKSLSETWPITAILICQIHGYAGEIKEETPFPKWTSVCAQCLGCELATMSVVELQGKARDA